MERLVECVPNFSEGRDRDTIDAITAAMEAAGATLLDVDMGAAANRTVVTIAGTPEQVAEAAFAGIRTAAERIDMRRHAGEHPRMGATDVCPFVPVAGVTMAECVELARQVGDRVGRDLGIPIYLYENAATRPERRSLADIRQGEYEALPAKLADPAWAPDFGPATFHAGAGATVIGAREFLIAYNVNLNTRERLLASRMAIRMREGGGPARGTDGERVLDPSGSPLRVPGALRAIRAVGWVIQEYGIAQVSVNVLDSRITPLHVVYEEARRQADLLGIAVTGSEIVGLVPREALLVAGRHYLERQGLSPAAPEAELIHVAVRSLGLNDAKPFIPEDKVIEYRLARGRSTLTDLPVRVFADQVSADAPTPGGGSVAALAGALGASLAAMVGNLTVRRPEHRDIRDRMTALATEAQALKVRLLQGVVEDSAAFEAVMDANRMPRNTPAEVEARTAAQEAANARATQVPFDVLALCEQAAILACEAADSGYENCLSDGAAGAAMALAGAEAAALNVRINLHAADASPEATRMAAEADATLARTRTRVRDLIDRVHQRLGTP
jgi:glutamate formiminotransferase/formiminotetrahydrofolate cyclodeaminase